MENTNTNIIQIEGKDLVNKILEVKGYKRYKATFDYSLTSIELDKVTSDYFNSKELENKIFYINNKHQYTDAIISVTFDYAIRNEEGKFITLDKNKSENLDNEYKKKKEVLVKSRMNKRTTKKEEKMEEVNNHNIRMKEKNRKIKKELKQLKKEYKSSSNKLKSTTSGIRRHLYEHGFDLNINSEVIHYTRFMRSSGSSREGKCMFIDERFYSKMIEWSLLGLDVKEGDKVDLASLESYIALPTSSIIDTMTIDPKSILIIDDYESEFPDEVLATRNKYDLEKNDGSEVLETKKESVSIRNSIWDGQSMMDSSLFEEKYADKGFLLTRNRFWKSACFNAEIQEFFKDNNITDISQLKGFTLATDIKDIKIITTPSSIKWEKFGGHTWKEDWLNRIDSTFGIVKYEKPTHNFNGNRVNMHYQLWNTLQFSKEKVREMMQPTFKYINRLRNDIPTMRSHINMKINNNTGDINSSDSLLLELLKISDKVAQTSLYTKYRSDIINDYIKDVRKGHVLIEGNYSVLCGNPIEMLQASCNLFDGNSLLNKDEVYSSNFTENEKLTGSRSPHVCISNIWLPRNCGTIKAKKIKKYMNVSKQIIYVNSIKNNLLERLSSSDFDSDSILITNSEDIRESAKKNYDKYLVPTSLVKATKVARHYTSEDKCDLDIKTSINKIGEIINISQILQSYLFDCINKNTMNEETQEDLYLDIAQLSIMSCIEIDSAKKEFTISNTSELKRIRDKWIRLDNGLKIETNIEKKTKKIRKGKKFKAIDVKISHEKPISYDESGEEILVTEEGIMNVRPMFFKEVGKGMSYHFKPFETSMDYLQEVIEENKVNDKRKAKLKLGELLGIDKKLKVEDKYRKRANELINKVFNLKKECNEVWANKDIDSKTKKEATNKLKTGVIKEVEDCKFDEESILRVFYLLYKEEISKDLKKIESKNKDVIKKENKSVKTVKKIKSIERKLISIIFASHQKEFRNILDKVKKEDVSTLRMDLNGDIDIYGIKYKKVKINISETPKKEKAA